MPRPTTKSHLIELAEREFAALNRQLAALPPEESLPAGTAESWAAGDYAAHLKAWQDLFFGWFEAGRRGENPPTPAAGYKWSQLPELNLEIYRKYREIPLAEILAGLHASHARLIELARNLPEEELFTPGRYAWTRANNLAAYMISVGSSHYLWARKEIQKIVKGSRQAQY